MKHIRDDFRHIGLPDTQVYALGVHLKRLIVTYNVKDFKPLAKQRKKIGIIGVSPLMPYHHIDTKLTSLRIPWGEPIFGVSIGRLDFRK